MKSIFYGEYKSAWECLARFMSTPTEDPLFPTQVAYMCSMCKKTHNFILAQTWNVSTVRQTEGFKSYCAFHSIETDVELP